MYQLFQFPPEGPRWVISDWGLVRRQELTTEIHMQAESDFGTQGFAPPEFWDNPLAANLSADIYSLGQVIAWGMTDRVPALNLPLLPAQAGWREPVEAMTRLEANERF